MDRLGSMNRHLPEMREGLEKDMRDEAGHEMEDSKEELDYEPYPVWKSTVISLGASATYHSKALSVSWIVSPLSSRRTRMVRLPVRSGSLVASAISNC